jgi:hypothetical protein
MILRELYYFNKKTMEPEEDHRYEPDRDKGTYSFSDTRQTRLTLGDINKARKADEKHSEEKIKDLYHVRAMYGISAQAPAEM